MQKNQFVWPPLASITSWIRCGMLANAACIQRNQLGFRHSFPIHSFKMPAQKRSFQTSRRQMSQTSKMNNYCFRRKKFDFFGRWGKYIPPKTSRISRKRHILSVRSRFFEAHTSQLSTGAKINENSLLNKKICLILCWVILENPPCIDRSTGFWRSKQFRRNKFWNS